jgi:hypothetical protein
VGSARLSYWSGCGSFPQTTTSLYAAQASASEDAAGNFAANGYAYTISPYGTDAWSYVWVGANFSTATSNRSIAVTLTWRVNSSSLYFFPGGPSGLHFVQHLAWPAAGVAGGSGGACTNGSPVQSSSPGGSDFSTSGPGTYTYHTILSCPGSSIAPGNWAAGLDISYYAGANLGEAAYSISGQLQSISVAFS